MRNRIRNELLPLLRSEFRANVDDSIERLAEQAGEVRTLVESQAEHVMERSCEWTTAMGFALNTTTLNAYPPLLVIEALRLAWRRAEFPEQAMTYQWWRQLAELASRSASSSVLNLPGNVRAERTGEVLMIERAPIGSASVD
jgi:tRNA(Ile)-lysidine synthase